MLMFDLHCHSLFSDGELLPSELVRRVEVKGYQAIAITDHADVSNIDLIIPRLCRLAEEMKHVCSTILIPGIEITHVPPDLIGKVVQDSRKLGARIVVCHGETIVEPVHPGTNRAALEAGVDILAHPGIIQAEDVELAAQKGIFLELSGRKGHSLTNGHVAKLAKKYGAKLTINSDGHAPSDFMSDKFARTVGRGAGLDSTEVEMIYEEVWDWLKKQIL